MNSARVLAAAACVIVTRPEPQAAQWVHQLQTHGVAAVALPLLHIVAAAPDAAQQHAVQQALAHSALVMFVSPNAVLHFFAGFGAGAPWPPGALAAATGPGTVQALREAGVPASHIAAPAADAAQWDSQALWKVLRERDWRGQRALIVRGEDGRDWLADTLRAAGATVEFVAAYRRVAPAWDQPSQALLDAALAQPDAHLWLFSSSQAVAHLTQRVQAGALAPPWPRMHALATHPRIAQAARQAGFAHVHEVPPQAQAVAAWVLRSHR